MDMNKQNGINELNEEQIAEAAGGFSTGTNIMSTPEQVTYLFNVGNFVNVSTSRGTVRCKIKDRRVSYTQNLPGLSLNWGVHGYIDEYYCEATDGNLRSVNGWYNRNLMEITY